MEVFECLVTQRSPINLTDVEEDILKGVARGKKRSNRRNNTKVNKDLHTLLIVFASFLHIVLGSEECRGDFFWNEARIGGEIEYRGTAELARSSSSPALEQLDQLNMK